MGWFSDWQEERTERVKARQEWKKAKWEAKLGIAETYSSAFVDIAEASGQNTAPELAEYANRNSVRNILEGSASVLHAGADLASSFTGLGPLSSVFGSGYDNSVDLSRFGIEERVPVTYIVVGFLIIILLISRK